MPDNNAENDGSPKPEGQVSSGTQTPPWGADFDADRAWRLIQNLRSEIDKIKGERDTLASERQARDDAEKTDLQKLSDRLKAAEDSRGAAEHALLIERAQRKHQLPDDLMEFLTGTTEEEIEDKAKRLAAIKGGSEEEQTDPNPDPSGRPKPSLIPGHNSPESNQFDAAAVAKEIRSKRY